MGLTTREKKGGGRARQGLKGAACAWSGPGPTRGARSAFRRLRRKRGGSPAPGLQVGALLHVAGDAAPWRFPEGSPGRGLGGRPSCPRGVVPPLAAPSQVRGQRGEPGPGDPP